MKATTSIRRRLLSYLFGALLALWLLIAIGSSLVVLKEINEIADSQMFQQAYTLRQISNHVTQRQIIKDVEDILPHNKGATDAEDHGFAVWSRNGTLLLADEEGQHIPFRLEAGFFNQSHVWDIDSWRYVYLVDNTRVVAVSQKVEERFEMLFSALWVQLSLILLSLPILLLLIIYGIKRGIAPLKLLSQELQARDAHSLQAVSDNVPLEIQPLVHELNQLLHRLENSLQKERRFISDASHELRSPLSALKVQVDVLEMSDKVEEQYHHIQNIKAGINRASRLVEQLLTLSRVDPMQSLPDTQIIDWQTLIPNVLKSVSLLAREKRIQLKLEEKCPLSQVLPLQGNSVLIELMLRNILDNAIRYSPDNTQVILSVAINRISVHDQGPGIAPEHISRIKERFYRPAGQSQQGSGLGFSIIESIAQLHGLSLHIDTQQAQGLIVSVGR